MAIIDRVKFDAPDDASLVWKFPSEQLRLGSQVIVNQSQEVVFLKGGQVADVLGPGTHTLTTGNLPIIASLVNFAFGGKTPFTAEIWYINHIVKRGLKWGTKGPIQIIDPLYKMPVSVRAFGQWGIRIMNTRLFMARLVGTLKSITSASVEEYFAAEIVQKLTDTLAKYFVEQSISIFQVAAKLNDLSTFTKTSLEQEFESYGVELASFNVERVSLPPEEQQRFQEILGRRMEIDQISQAKVGEAYVTMRSFDTLEKAASNEGGSAGALLSGGLGLGMGLGAGTTVGQQVAQHLAVSKDSAADDPMAKLATLKKLLEANLISNSDYEAKKAKILEGI